MCKKRKKIANVKVKCKRGSGKATEENSVVDHERSHGFV